MKNHANVKDIGTTPTAMEEVREQLSRNINDLRDGKISVEEAAETSKCCEKIISSYRKALRDRAAALKACARQSKNR